MTGAEKSLALHGLADEASRHGLGLIDAALTQIAGLDLSDQAVCFRWYNAIVDDRHDGSGTRQRILSRAAAVVICKVAP